MRRGLYAGLIAGIVAGIVATILAIILLTIGFAYPNVPIFIIAATEITIGLIWGAILGAIYSKFYDLIPGKGVSKGLSYGLILYLIFSIRTGTMNAIHGYHLEAIVWFFTIHPIIYGLLLGILYKAPTQKLKVIKHDMRGGIHPGAIAGLIGGIAASSGVQISSIIGLAPPIQAPPIIETAAIMVEDMCWGAIFGVLFVVFYDQIPSKGIIKGLYFGLIVFLITNLRVSAYMLAYGFFIAHWRMWFSPWTTAGFLHFIVLGLLLGALYKK